MISMISEVVNRNSSQVLIMDDFNHPGIDWSMQTSTGSTQEQIFIEEYQEWFMWQHTKQPKRYRGQLKANSLDFVMTNEDGMINSIDYEETIGMNDHVTLSWTLHCNTQATTTQIKKYLYDKENYNDIREDMSVVNWDDLLKDKTAKEQWNIISNRLQESVNKNVPSKLVGSSMNGHRRPKWMSTRVYQKSNKREKFLKII